MSFNVWLWTHAWCKLSMCLVKIVCVRKFVFKPPSPEYVVSRKPNKGITNYLAIPTHCANNGPQHCQRETYLEEKIKIWEATSPWKKVFLIQWRTPLFKTFLFYSKTNERMLTTLFLQKGEHIGLKSWSVARFCSEFQEKGIWLIEE